MASGREARNPAYLLAAASGEGRGGSTPPDGLPAPRCTNIPRKSPELLSITRSEYTYQSASSARRGDAFYDLAGRLSGVALSLYRPAGYRGRNADCQS